MKIMRILFLSPPFREGLGVGVRR
ncbi:hypothetical protein ERY430_80325 [Erythrobacter sp. EC-HK427]|nr:hypothetical protein ERY430_80325 [Erythrobacter sp. EC-HK427]